MADAGVHQTLMPANAASPLRSFLRTESNSAGVLVAAIAAALVWANVAPEAYEAFWTWALPVRIGPLAADLDLREWVDSGLMTFFFLVVGLEARRELDLGDLRDRRGLILPVTAGFVGMVVPVLLYLGVNHTGSGAYGWGIAMSTDTALALGVFTVAGRGLPNRVRTFLLTVFVVDDVVALVVIAVVYSGPIQLPALVVAVVAFAGVLLSTRLSDQVRKPLFSILAVVVWGALLASGIDPVVAGLAVGLAATAYVPRRDALEAATTLVRLFREQPTAEAARTATRGLAGTLSANARMQHTFHRLASYLIVPLFALANAGIGLGGDVLAEAVTAPITIGVLLAYVAGKPIAVLGSSWLTTRISRDRLRPQVGWVAVLGSGTIAGIGFTVSLLIAGLAFEGRALQDAKLGVLAAATGSSLLSILVFRLVRLLPERTRTRALLGRTRQIVDLLEPVDPGRDHARGPADAAVTVVEYGDFQCPWTQMVAPTARELLAENADIQYVWRHLPLQDVHPNAYQAAEAAEAAGVQGKFWPMHDLLLTNQEKLGLDDLIAYATELGLDLDRFRADLARHSFAARVAQDIDTADLSGVAGTPTFFVNDRRHDGPQDLATLTNVIREARAQAVS